MTQLQADLCAPTYGFTPAGKKYLEPKEKVKERIGRSPDLADALALTFAAPVRLPLNSRFERQLYGDDSREYDADKAFDEQWRR